MARYRQIFKNRNFSLLWVGQIVSQFGDRLSQMALIALISRFAPGSTTSMAKLMSFTIIPVFLVGPVAGVYVDRWDRRKTMIVCDILRAFFVLSIPFFFLKFDSLLAIYIIVFLVFSVSRFYIPAKMSIIPDLVKSDDLLLANSLVSVTGMVAVMFGLGLGGLLVDLVGAKGGFVIDGLTFLFSGVMVFFLSVKRFSSFKTGRLLRVGKDIAEVIKRSVASEMKETIVFLKSQRQVRSCFAVLFLLWAALGSIYAVSIVFVQKVFASVTKDLGLLVVAVGLGLFGGSLVYGRFGHRFKEVFKVIFICIFLCGVVLFTFVFALVQTSHLLLGLILAFLLGAVVSPVMVVSNTMVHQLTDNAMRGKVFSSLEIIVHLAFLLAMLVSAPLADSVGEVKVLLTVCILLVLIGALGVLSIYGRQIRRT